MTSDSPIPGRVRASDAEREEYASIIREAVGEGRLSLPEGDERLAQVYAARHREDLRPLIADLPRGAARGPQGWRPYESQPATRDGSHPYRPMVVRQFAFLLTVSAVLVGLWAIGSSTFFWPAIPISFFAIFAVRRAFGLGWYHRRWYR
jgi:hypothetical protein